MNLNDIDNLFLAFELLLYSVTTHNTKFIPFIQSENLGRNYLNVSPAECYTDDIKNKTLKFFNTISYNVLGKVLIGFIPYKYDNGQHEVDSKNGFNGFSRLLIVHS